MIAQSPKSIAAPETSTKAVPALIPTQMMATGIARAIIPILINGRSMSIRKYAASSRCICSLVLRFRLAMCVTIQTYTSWSKDMILSLRKNLYMSEKALAALSYLQLHHSKNLGSDELVASESAIMRDALIREAVRKGWKPNE